MYVNKTIVAFFASVVVGTIVGLLLPYTWDGGLVCGATYVTCFFVIESLLTELNKEQKS